MIHPPTHPRAGTIAAWLAAGLLLAGCSSAPEEPASPSSATPSASASAVASGSASPGPTLTPQEQQAVEEAAAVVLAYRQTTH